MKDKVLLGHLVANAFAIIVSLLLRTLAVNGGIVASQFLILPLLMGIIAAWFWKDTGIRRGKIFLHALYMLLAICSWSWFFLGEGYICLIIVSPIIYMGLFTGGFIGRYMFRNRNNNLNLSILSLLVLIGLGDVVTRHHFEAMVSDTIVVNAPVAKVWPYVVAYEPIKEQADYWLFRIGMPAPIASTVTGYGKGEGRKCIFDNGYVFDEVMTVYQTEKELTFEVTNQPRDPEIMGHIDILKGQFLLKDNGDGTTTVTGNSWYRLHIFPSWYYNIWAESITRNVHIRVMENIKRQCEKDAV